MAGCALTSNSQSGRSLSLLLATKPDFSPPTKNRK